MVIVYRCQELHVMPFIFLNFLSALFHIVLMKESTQGHNLDFVTPNVFVFVKHVPIPADYLLAYAISKYPKVNDGYLSQING